MAKLGQRSDPDPGKGSQIPMCRLLLAAGGCNTAAVRPLEEIHILANPRTPELRRVVAVPPPNPITGRKDNIAMSWLFLQKSLIWITCKLIPILLGNLPTGHEVKSK